MERLLEDIREVGPVLQPLLDTRISPSFFEFTAYYKVGFVTCLEWHAKSRLYDMFCYDPKTIKNDDLKQAISNEKLVSMVSEGLTIPHLLAGSNSISSRDSYIAAISRVFSTIGAQDGTLSQILDDKKDDAALGQVLEELYLGRNDLVHEIGIQTIGHPNVRDFDSFEAALSGGERLLGMMRTIEDVVTKVAPSNFPNKLGEDGFPVSEEEVLAALISSMEGKIDEAIASDTAGGELTLDDWRREIANRRSSLSAELAFIDSLGFAGGRYYDVRPFLKSTVLRQRSQYLALLSEQML
ncbi:hypothetical protein AB4Z52_29425 [Rhizobium sp. 2YAF20]|uniref:hypothetical protein n=1 Tax=Rhizobium sp. 2YAF20 TaxID=3233027 RepID=UPI003F9CC53C